MMMLNDRLFVKTTVALILSVLPIFVMASETVAIASIGAYTKASFAPVRDEVFAIPVVVENPERLKDLKVEIRTSDDDLIRTLNLTEFSADTKEYEIKWDGRDASKAIVPDEGYHPILLVTDKSGKVEKIGNRSASGGEEVYDFEKNIRPGAIEYTLPVASRVLVRAGIKNGPMLRTVIDWEPRTKGFHVDRWNGRDLDNVIAVEQNPQAGYLIVGYQLPDNTIITYGNTKETYRAYRERHKYPLKEASYENRLLERNSKVIRPEYYNPVLQQKSPRIEVNLLAKDTRQPTETVKGLDELLTEVQLHPLDEIYLDQERYEISFFVDNEFVAEEEQGFVPFTWRWSPGRFGFKPGEHVLTVNVSGYNGQVGVRNTAFNLIVEKADDQSKQ
ncbi:MAG: hypothetical protein ABW168_21675 [Sedimenticola sp.]